MRFFTGLICMIVGIMGTFAQTSQCTRALERIEDNFEQGKLLDVLNDTQFLNCLENNNFTTEESIRAHKLLTKVYIFADNEQQAETALVDLLKVDKEHRLTVEDPAELYFLYSKFKTDPIFRIGLRGGVNKSVPSVIQSHNTFQVGGKKYNPGGNASSGWGIWGEMVVEKHIAKGIEIGLGAQFQIANYGIEGQLLTGADQGQLFYNVKNNSTILKVPLLVRYNLGYHKETETGRIKWIPYVFFGGSFDYLLNAGYVATDRTGGTAFTLNKNNSLKDFDQVAKTNVSVFVGIGTKYRIANVHFVTFEIRYNNVFFNYINPDNRYANKDINFDIGHVEDDLTLNTIAFSLGYTRSIYKPRKRRQYR